MENTPDARPRVLEPLFATDAHAARRLRGAAEGAAPSSVPAAKRARLDDDEAGPSAPDSAPPLRLPLRERAGDDAAAGEDEMVNCYEVRWARESLHGSPCCVPLLTLHALRLRTWSRRS